MIFIKKACSRLLLLRQVKHLLDSDEHVIKIVERNVNIDYSVVFKNVFDKFIDKFSRDVMYKIIHEILFKHIVM
jgi:hypothetical protein